MSGKWAKPKNRKGATSRGYCKAVDRTAFEDAILDYAAGRLKLSQAAEKCGVSEKTFIKRVNQYFEPDTYGELPEQFFIGEDDARKCKLDMNRIIQKRINPGPTASTLPDPSTFGKK